MGKEVVKWRSPEASPFLSRWSNRQCLCEAHSCPGYWRATAPSWSFHFSKRRERWRTEQQSPGACQDLHVGTPESWSPLCRSEGPCPLPSCPLHRLCIRPPPGDTDLAQCPGEMNPDSYDDCDQGSSGFHGGLSSDTDRGLFGLTCTLSTPWSPWPGEKEDQLWSLPLWFPTAGSPDARSRAQDHSAIHLASSPLPPVILLPELLTQPCFMSV
ncbi:unnamed protein product [Rangifer tarandus platyrhynchus]|uniref:Uncharacterized protein n=1 Tax=Rangifer tarandus platyrhynchus TaxID=3082113 RepID=A0AC59Z7M4_RANTA